MRYLPILFLFGCTKPVQPIDDCPKIGIMYQDTPIQDSVLRTWTVIDWCQYNPQRGRGVWVIKQMIKP